MHLLPKITLKLFSYIAQGGLNNADKVLGVDFYLLATLAGADKNKVK